MAKGIFENIKNLFKTTEQLNQEGRQRKRMYERAIEKAIDTLKDSQRTAEKEKDKFYQQAKQSLAVGKKEEARQYMQFSRMQFRNASNYTRQQLIWTNALTTIRVGSTMQIASSCFKQLAEESGLDSNVFEDGLDSVSEVESVIGEMNKAMSKKWEKDSLKAGEAGEVEGDASIDEMMAQAEREVAAENGAAPTEGASASAAS